MNLSLPRRFTHPWNTVDGAGCSFHEAADTGCALGYPIGNVQDFLDLRVALSTESSQMAPTHMGLGGGGLLSERVPSFQHWLDEVAVNNASRRKAKVRDDRRKTLPSISLPPSPPL